MRSLEEVAQEQHQGRSMAELAPWLFPLSNTIVVNKDSSIMSCFEFEGVDTDGASESELEALAYNLNRTMLTHQDEPLAVWWRVNRTRTTEYPSSVFPDPVSKLIDDARHEAFLKSQNFINRHSISTVLMPSAGALRIRDRVASAIARGDSLWSGLKQAAESLFDDQREFQHTDDELSEAARKLEKICAGLQENLPHLDFRQLAGTELGAFLHGCISPQAAHQKHVALARPQLSSAWLDATLPEGTLVAESDHLVHRGFKTAYTYVVTIKEFEKEIHLGALDAILSIPGELTINYALRHIPLAESEKHAEKMRNLHSSGSFSWRTTVRAATSGDSSTSGPTNKGRTKMSGEADDALGLLTGKELGGLWFYCSILCHGATQEEAYRTAERVEAVMRHAHLTPEIETMHALSGFATSIPGMWKECARWRFFNSAAFSTIAPVHTVSKGKTENRFLSEQTKQFAPAMTVLPTDYNTPFYYSIHRGDLGHGLLIGPSRGGKTTLGNFLWSQFRRYPDAQVIVFDKDFSSRISILLQGGTYIDFTRPDAPRPNPLATLTQDSITWTAQFIELLLAQRDYRVNAGQAKQIEEGLRATLRLSPDIRRLSSFYAHITDPALREQLDPWVGDRLLAKYFDNEQDGFELSNLIGVEIGAILEDKQLAVPMMEYFFYRIDQMLLAQRKQGIVRPTFIYVPEVWNLLKYLHYANKFNDWLKTLAKRCAVVWMDTQSPEDLLQSSIWPALRDNIPNRIYIPNDKAKEAGLYDLYARQLGMSDLQIQRIIHGVQKRDYYFQHGDVYRMVQLRFDKRTLSALRSDMAAQICFDEHYAQREENPDWWSRYIDAAQKV